MEEIRLFCKRFSAEAGLIFLLILIKVVLMSLVPVLSDEAYYVYWGTHFAGGYYDLPPMIGWWESAFASAGMSPFVLRLPNLWVAGVIAFWIYRILKGFNISHSFWVAGLYFVLPFDFLGVLISPDVPLIFFSFFSAMLFFDAHEKMRAQQCSPLSAKIGVRFLCAGMFWGAAFLSKYFALALVPAFIVWVLVSNKMRKDRFAGFVSIGLCFLGALPCLIQHLWWNSQNCWANFGFNLITRQKVVDGPELQILLFFLLYLVILATPLLIYEGMKRRKGIMVSNESLQRFQTFCLGMWGIPMLLFGVSALMGKGQGIHWYLSYLPFFVLWVGIKMEPTVARSQFKWVGAFSAVIGIACVLILLSPEWVKQEVLKGRFKLDIELAQGGSTLVEQITPLLDGVDGLFTDAYVYSSTLDYQLRRFGAIHSQSRIKGVGFWGPGSRFGRVFDWTNHFADLEGKTLLLFSGVPPSVEGFQSFFDQVQTQKFNLNGATYFLTKANHFRSRSYIEKVLNPVFESYYPFSGAGSRCPIRN